ncbi:hypothetical protein [[Eubacterium] hominis]|uniref:hypothetical protein n=1 Tax=[Eubacterium] hominis TaxID=2764325 RepID=UPI003A4D4B71
MKKSKYISLVIGVFGIMLIGLSMCMCTIPKWNLQREGTILGLIGLFVLWFMVIVYRKMEHKAPLVYSKKTILKVIGILLGLLGFGIGMCFTMVFHQMLLGIVIGMLSIMMLIGFIPFMIGLK